MFDLSVRSVILMTEIFGLLSSSAFVSSVIGRCYKQFSFFITFFLVTAVVGLLAYHSFGFENVISAYPLLQPR